MADAIKLSCRNSQTISPFIPVSPSTSCQRAQVGPRRSVVSLSGVSSAACAFLCPTASTTPKKLGFFKIYATVTETEQPKWWERNAGPNMIDIHSTQEFLNALSEAGDRLVIVEFYGTWCASCRAIFPKICRTAVEHHDILFLKVNFDENKPMCKKLNVRVLPYFQFYRGADGLLEAFSCSLSKFQRIKDAIELHSSARCSLGPPKGIPDLNLESPQSPKENLEESSGT